MNHPEAIAFCWKIQSSSIPPLNYCKFIEFTIHIQANLNSLKDLKVLYLKHFRPVVLSIFYEMYQWTQKCTSILCITKNIVSYHSNSFLNIFYKIALHKRCIIMLFNLLFNCFVLNLA